MGNQQQIFHTNSPWRRVTYQWVLRLALFFSLLVMLILVITYYRAQLPQLPSLKDEQVKKNGNLELVKPVAFSAAEIRRYRGFADYLASRGHTEMLIHGRMDADSNRIRAGFFVDWDPQSFYALQQGIGQMNMVFPEWFFIDPDTDTLRPQIDMPALALMRAHKIRILPLVNNINDEKDGGFDAAMLHRILHDQEKRKRLIHDLVHYVTLYQLQGINVDFEEFHEKSDEPIVSFQKEIYEAFHARGLLVTQDVMVNNEDFNLKRLAAFNDYMVLMAYDQHWSTSVPGPVCDQKWIEKVVDEAADKLPPSKIILGLAGYGYDWPPHGEAETVTYQQALAKARMKNALIHFDNDSYNLHYTYTDDEGGQHEVYFTDASSNFNTVRFADEYGLKGTALWRLGSEDQRLWQYYALPLDNRHMAEKVFDPAAMQSVHNLIGKPDYIGDGEVLDVVASPEKGKIRLVVDSTEQVISEEYYDELPTKYVIRKFGNVQKQVVLTFDDGPDPVYTPQILDLLKKEKIPAVFFIVGLEAERNLPLLKRIYREGHEIGNHTFTHPNMAQVSLERATSEMETTRLLIEAVTGRSTVLFRAPYNADAEPSSEVELRPVALSKAKDYYTVGESIDPNDWEAGVTADTIYERTIRQYEANPSKGIILLHDAGGNRQATVDALPRIIAYFRQHQISFVSVSDLLHVDRNKIMPAAGGRLLRVDARIVELLYELGQVLNSAFWVAIILGMLRILMMGMMAHFSRRKDKKAQASLQPLREFPLVSIIVPAYNEEVNAVKTVENLLLQDYPALEILFIDDGSKDQTFEKVRLAFRDNPRVRVVTKVNGGKSSALNEGIQISTAAYLVCIDADTQLRTNAVTKLMEKLCADERVGAVAGNVKAGNLRTVLARWQHIEYVTAQNFDRRAFDLINGITVVPGAIGAFRRSALETAGGFTSDTLAEDCDLTIRIIRSGFTVVNCTEAIAVTEVPETYAQFMKQRFRWSYGVMQTFWKHRDACFNPKYRGLGMIALPNVLLFQILMPMLAPLADLILVFSLVWNRSDPGALWKISTFYLVFLAVDLLVSLVAFGYEKENRKTIWWLLPQRFIYRQLMYVILFRALGRALKGEAQSWGTLKRTGSVQQLKGAGIPFGRVS